jgi:hypothetical protein
MSKGNQYETDILALILNATAIADLAENDSSSPITNLHVSLHTGDPGEAGDQETSEATYTGYARQPVARTSGGFTVANGAASNTSAITFDECTAGSNTITHFAVGTLISGTGKILYSGALDASLAVSAGITPEFAAGDLDITED